MVEQLSWKVGGQQGEGIESTGEIFSTGLNRLGYYLYGYRHFSSRIKGGHTNNKVRVSTKEIRSVADDLDILVAFDQETIDLNYKELNMRGIILADEKAKPISPDDYQAHFYSVPFSEIASQLGTTLMKNMVAIGATCAVLDLKTDIFAEVVKEIFNRKGKTVVEKNIQALELGYEYLKKQLPEDQLIRLEKADGKRRMYMIGNDAIGMGALAAGARLMFAYPITPASDIMEYLIKNLPKFGGAVIQTEDEMAACTMAIGANYGGVRSFTASAGPGLSLMMESIGLAGMTETPLVIVDTQRGGPSTGLPTKQEQSDLMAMIYGTHGEIPKVVLAPSTVEEAFFDTVDAFNIAEEYQVPVIILSDLQLSLGKQTVTPFDISNIEIKRGAILSNSEPSTEKKKGYFNRYQLSDNGISMRSIPGTRGGIHHVTGVEHDETGRPQEGAANRRLQMDKRLSKLSDFSYKNAIHKNINHAEPDLLLVGFNSTRGAIEEAMEKLNQDGLKINHLHIRLLHPFPEDEVRPLLDKAKRVAVVEQNGTGQLANLLKMNLGFAEKIFNILKYDGNPLLPEELFKMCQELLQNEGVLRR